MVKKINVPTPKYHEFAVQSVKNDVAKMEAPIMTNWIEGERE